MNGVSAVLESSRVAKDLSQALETGDFGALERGLERAESLAAWPAGLRPHAAEQVELLGAIAGDIRDSVARLRRQLTPSLEGTEVHLSLLRHLAHAAPAPTTEYPRSARTPVS